MNISIGLSVVKTEEKLEQQMLVGDVPESCNAGASEANLVSFFMGIIRTCVCVCVWLVASLQSP